MSIAYDYDAAETVPAMEKRVVQARHPGSSASQAENPRVNYAIYDPIVGKTFLPRDQFSSALAVTSYGLVSPEFSVGSNTPVLSSVAFSTADFALTNVVNRGMYLPTSNSIFESSTGVGSVALSTLIEQRTDTFNVANVKSRDPLSGYEAYCEPNWDHYGAEPITADTLVAARRFIRMLPAFLGDPAVAPCADGSIALEWAFKNHPLRKLFIDIGPNNIWNGYWRMADGRKGTIGPMEVDDTTKAVLIELFRSFG